MALVAKYRGRGGRMALVAKYRGRGEGGKWRIRKILPLSLVTVRAMDRSKKALNKIF
jgi:hypothetical protein